MTTIVVDITLIMWTAAGVANAEMERVVEALRGVGMSVAEAADSIAQFGRLYTAAMQEMNPA